MENKNQRTYWSNIVGFYLFFNGAFAFFTSSYYVYAQPDLLLEYNKYTYLFNNLIYPCFSMLAGYILFFFIKHFDMVLFYLRVSILGFGLGNFIYWSAHGYSLSFYTEISGVFIGINITSIIGILMLYKHRAIITSTSSG